MRRGSDDVAMSDIVGTLLMVGAVVTAGSAMTVIVAANLQTPDTPIASFSLARVEAADDDLRLLHRNGNALALTDVLLLLARGDNAPAPIPRAQWTTPDPTVWHPGETLSATLAPTVSSGERLRVQLVHAPTGALLADLAASAPSAGTPLASPTLSGVISPSSIIADAATTALITVRISHPLGALGIATVSADLTNLSRASNSANATLRLSDTGEDGDVFGGDGIWSALLRAPMNATPGTYEIPIVARDVAGYDAARTSASLTITANFTSLVANLTGLDATLLNAGAIANISSALVNLSVLGNLTSLLANLTGATPGVVVLNTTAAGEGTRLAAPTSQNTTRFHLTNFTYDRSNPTTIQNDAAVVRLLSRGYAWSAYLKFDYVDGVAGIARLEMWSSNSTAGRTIYTPASGGVVSIVDLDLNMTHPQQSGFACSARCSPAMTYPNADIRGNPTFVIPYMRDEWNNPDASDLGVYAFEAIHR